MSGDTTEEKPVLRFLVEGKWLSMVDIVARIAALETQVREMEARHNPLSPGHRQALRERVANADNAPPRPLEDDEVFHDGVIWQLDPELVKALKRG